ncbi:hypothetical protein GDO78_023059, partial [Eleutherodactylus coqui]
SSGSCGEITVTVSPDYISVSPGDTVTMLCISSQDIVTLNWYQQKPGKSPKPLIRGAEERLSGIPERFSGSGKGIVFALTITGVTADDLAHYYCQQGYSFPLTQ